MKLKNKLPISFKDFFSLGEFDFLELGKSKEWIISNFSNPDAFEKIEDKEIIYEQKRNIYCHRSNASHT